ncbi:MAG TPA: hypothetical protein VMJ10_19045 [Kofleriaceae bacterium]|nr:hypothetical protein [Kofleriaceae bacterium]
MTTENVTTEADRNVINSTAVERGRLRWWILTIAALIATVLVIVIWQRAHARTVARNRLTAIADEFQRCVLGADHVPDDQVIRTLYLRTIEGAEPSRCWLDAKIAVTALTEDYDYEIDRLPDDVRSSAHLLSDGVSDGIHSGGLTGICEAVHILREAAPPHEHECSQPVLDAARAAVGPHSSLFARLDGELLVPDQENSNAVERYRPDRSLVDRRRATSFNAIDGDDLVFVAEDHRLARWRGQTRVDGPVLPVGLDLLMAWRHTDAGDLGVFLSDKGDDHRLRLQHFDEHANPVGAAVALSATASAGDLVVLGPDGAVSVSPALENRSGQCSTATSFWRIDGTLVRRSPIGGSPSVEGRLPADAEPVASDCDDASLYLVTTKGYVKCTQSRCVLARPLPQVEAASVRTYGGGAVAIASLGGRVAMAAGGFVGVVLRDTGDGNPTIEPRGLPSDFRGPYAFDGHWFLVRLAQ